MGGVITPADAPKAVHGTVAIHLHSPTGNATLENSHWPDEPATWTPVTNLQDITGNAGVVLEIAGHVRLVGPADAKCSIVFVSIGGAR